MTMFSLCLRVAQALRSQKTKMLEGLKQAIRLATEAEADGGASAAAPPKEHAAAVEAQDEAAAAEGSWKRLKLRADELPRSSGERWEASLAALQAYVEENGGRYPSQSSACAAERSLHTWCTNQRAVRRGTANGGVLSAAQGRLLQQMRGWSWGAASHAALLDSDEDGEESEEEEEESEEEEEEEEEECPITGVLHKRRRLTQQEPVGCDISAAGCWERGDERAEALEWQI